MDLESSQNNLKNFKNLYHDIYNPSTTIEHDAKKFLKIKNNSKSSRKSGKNSRVETTQNSIKRNSEKETEKSQLDIFTQCQTSHQFSRHIDSITGMGQSAVNHIDSEFSPHKSNHSESEGEFINHKQFTSLQENMKTPRRKIKKSMRSMIDRNLKNKEKPKIKEKPQFQPKLDYSEYYDEMRKRESKRNSSSKKKPERFNKIKQVGVQRKKNQASIQPENEYHQSASRVQKKKMRKMKKTQSSTKISFNGFLKAGKKKNRFEKKKRVKNGVSSSQNGISVGSYGSYNSYHGNYGKKKNKKLKNGLQKSKMGTMSKERSKEEVRFHDNERKIRNLEMMMKNMNQEQIRGQGF